MVTNLVCLAIMIGQEATEQDLHGKSLPEIVEMGREGWYDFYIEEEGGESTATMSYADYYYGSALLAENDKGIEATSELGMKIAFFRVSMQDFRTKCIEVGRAYTGGGTMWNIVYSATVPDTEEVVYYWLNKQNPPGFKEKSMKADQAKVWEMLKSGRSDLRRQQSDIEDGAEFSRIQYSDVAKGMEEAFGLFGQAVAQMEGLDKETKARMFAFYLQAATMTKTPDLPV